jgi:hypothetical protein
MRFTNELVAGYGNELPKIRAIRAIGGSISFN